MFFGSFFLGKPADIKLTCPCERQWSLPLWSFPGGSSLIFFFFGGSYNFKNTPKIVGHLERQKKEKQDKKIDYILSHKIFWHIKYMMVCRDFNCCKPEKPFCLWKMPRVESVKWARKLAYCWDVLLRQLLDAIWWPCLSAGYGPGSKNGVQHWPFLCFMNTSSSAHFVVALH